MNKRKAERIFWSVVLPFAWMLVLFKIISLIGGDLISRELVTQYLNKSDIWGTLELLIFLIGFYVGWYALGKAIYLSIPAKTVADGEKK